MNKDENKKTKEENLKPDIPETQNNEVEDLEHDKKVEQYRKEKLSDNELLMNLNNLKNKNSWKKYLVGGILGIVVILGIINYSVNHMIANDKYAFKMNDIKIERTTYDKIYSIFEKKYDTSLNLSEEQKKEYLENSTIYFIVDNYYLSNLAKENNISVSEEDIKTATDEFGVLGEEIALSRKVFMEKEALIKNVSNETLKEFYEKNKDLFLKEGNVEFIPIASKTEINSEKEIDYSKFKIQKEKVSELILLGIYSFELKDKSLISLGYDSDEEVYRYFYIDNIQNKEYSTFEDSIDNVKYCFDSANGLVHLNRMIIENQTNTSIQVYN